MRPPKILAGLFLPAVLFLGCGQNQPFDEQSLKDIGASLSQQIEQIQKENPDLRKKADELIGSAVTTINNHIDLNQLCKELMETSKFDPMRGFYNPYSPFQNDTGLESLDSIIAKAKELRSHRFEVDTDINSAAQDVVFLILGDKLAEMGLTSEQIQDFVKHIVPTLQLSQK